MRKLKIKTMWILSGICLTIIAVLAGYYIEAAIYVKREMRRERENETSFTNHNWKKFKNQPWK